MRRETLVLCALSLFTMPMLGACGGDEPRPVMPAPPVEPPPAPTVVEKPAEPPPAPKPSIAELQKAALGTALQGLNGHDPKMFASVYADDAIISVAGLNEVNGREAIAQNMAEWFEVFSKAKLGFSRVWVKGHAMVLEWVINGTHHGELFGVKGTEQPIGHYGLSIVHFNDEGKVQREDRFGELGAVMTQVGAAGAKAKPRPIPDVPAAPETIVATGTEEKNLDVAKTVLTALENKKEADFTAALTDDVEQDGVFHLETSKGKDGAKKFFKSFTTAFPDAKFDVKKAFAIGDYAIVMSTMTATQKGALGQIPATKRPVAVHLVDIFKIKDGKVARAWTYQNSLEMQQQLGLFQVTAGNVPASQAAPAAPKPGTGTTTPAPTTGPKAGGGGGGGGTGGGKDTGGGGGKGTGGGSGGGTGGKK
ncbi:MAG: hypothetical protein QOI41_1942 [Myxococcales bacterium]|jgi:steroid delta-isomerase-like uncharacterized protein|nr:hypothetical protein [Myxococcales bacterium]